MALVRAQLTGPMSAWRGARSPRDPHDRGPDGTAAPGPMSIMFTAHAAHSRPLHRCRVWAEGGSRAGVTPRGVKRPPPPGGGDPTPAGAGPAELPMRRGDSARTCPGPCIGRARCRGRSDRSALTTGTVAPGAVIGQRAEHAHGPARRAAPPGDRGEKQEQERDRANDGDQHDREHGYSQANRASEEMLVNRTARKRRALRTRWFWRDLALGRHRTLVSRRGRARITRSPSPRVGVVLRVAFSWSRDAGKTTRGV